MQAMTSQAPVNAFGVRLERIPDNVLCEPIEYIFADHCRQRDMCEALQALASLCANEEIEAEPAQVLLDWLTVDLPLHIADEEHDLFPRLGAKALPEDKFPDILRLLGTEHERDRDLTAAVIKGLGELAVGSPLKDSEGFRIATEVFAASHLSHLNWENAVVLTLARQRLGQDDQNAMAHNMAARREIELPDS